MRAWMNDVAVRVSTAEDDLISNLNQSSIQFTYYVVDLTLSMDIAIREYLSDYNGY